MENATLPSTVNWREYQAAHRRCLHGVCSSGMNMSRVQRRPRVQRERFHLEAQAHHGRQEAGGTDLKIVGINLFIHALEVSSVFSTQVNLMDYKSPSLASLLWAFFVLLEKAPAKRQVVLIDPLRWHKGHTTSWALAPSAETTVAAFVLTAPFETGKGLDALKGLYGCKQSAKYCMCWVLFFAMVRCLFKKTKKNCI